MPVVECRNLSWLIVLAVISAGTAAEVRAASCPANRKVVEISGLGDETERARQRTCLVKTLHDGNAIIHLGPDVDFDFSDVDVSDFPIQFGSCVTIQGVATLGGGIPCL